MQDQDPHSGVLLALLLSMILAPAVVHLIASLNSDDTYASRQVRLRSE